MMVVGAFVMQAASGNAQNGVFVKPGLNKTVPPFSIHIVKIERDDLKRGILATRWTRKETASDRSQNSQLSVMQKFPDSQATNYDDRRAKAKLNVGSHFITKIDAPGIHFIRARLKKPGMPPPIDTRGWSGSLLEQIKLIVPLAWHNPYKITMKKTFN